MHTEKNETNNKPWPLEVGTEILGRMREYRDGLEQIKQEVAHIKNPMTMPEIIRQYASGCYEAEHLLQHLMIHITSKLKLK
jgi:cell fate (sporulation/competence/biofilm development) regulator YmcA (YheA/YmcA/DUF963 family)